MKPFFAILMLFAAAASATEAPSAVNGVADAGSDATASPDPEAIRKAEEWVTSQKTFNVLASRELAPEKAIAWLSENTGLPVDYIRKTYTFEVVSTSPIGLSAVRVKRAGATTASPVPPPGAVAILPSQRDPQNPLVALPPAASPDAATDAEVSTVADRPPLPDFIIGKRGYYSASVGFLRLPKPEGDADFVKIDFSYLYVDQGLAQIYQIHLGMGDRNQALALGYGLGFGPRDGRIHLGLKANLGYAHLYQEADDKHIHGLYLGLNPMVMGTFWKNWQFFLEAGWNFIPLASETIPKGRGFTGWNIGLGVGTSLD